MDERNWVIADIPVRKGLEERYCVHVNAATDRVSLSRVDFHCRFHLVFQPHFFFF